MSRGNGTVTSKISLVNETTLHED